MISVKNERAVAQTLFLCLCRVLIQRPIGNYLIILTTDPAKITACGVILIWATARQDLTLLFFIQGFKRVENISANASLLIECEFPDNPL